MDNCLLFNIIKNMVRDCVFWKDKNGYFVGCNQSFLDYFKIDSLEDLVGKNENDIYQNDELENEKQEDNEILSGGEILKKQKTIIINGDRRKIFLSKKPIFDNDKIVGIAGCFFEKNDEDKSKMEFIHNISTPLENAHNFAHKNMWETDSEKLSYNMRVIYHFLEDIIYSCFFHSVQYYAKVKQMDTNDEKFIEFIMNKTGVDRAHYEFIILGIEHKELMEEE